MKYDDTLSCVTNEIETALEKVDGEKVETLIDMICSAEKIFVVGAGRVLISLHAWVKRFNHLGIKTNFVGAVDEPAITDKDILIVGSGSGESVFPVAISRIAKKYDAKVVHIGSNPKSSVGEISDLFIRIPCRTKLNLKDEIDSMQPMTSLFEQSIYILGDIIACMIIERKGLDLKTLWRMHANLE